MSLQPDNRPGFGRVKVNQEQRLPIYEQIVQEIDHYTVSFVVSGKLIGSGTLVDAWNRLGILTAYHVAMYLFAGENSTIEIIVAGHEHRFSIPTTHLDPRTIGKPDTADESRGPDLSFLQILDLNKLATLASKKSFFNLSRTNLSDFGKIPYAETPWFLAGAPAEDVEHFHINSRSVLSAQHLIGEATFGSLTSHEGFDYLKLRVPTATNPYPSDFGGVSGGGMWMIQLSKDSPEDPTLSYEAPFFAGVAFHQSPPENGERIITGHGPSSIRDALKTALSAER